MFRPKQWYRYFTDYKEITLYIIFGVLTTAVSLGTYYPFDMLFSSISIDNTAVGRVIAAVLKTNKSALPVVGSWVCAVTFAYVTNRLWVFEHKRSGVFGILREMGLFYGGRVVTLFVDLLICWLLIDLPGNHAGLHVFLVRCFSSVFVLVLNYIISKFLVFRKKK